MRFMFILLFVVSLPGIYSCTMSGDERGATEGKAVTGGRTGRGSEEGDVERGRELFEKLCSFCHKTNSTGKEVGPGLLGVLRRPHLPASGKPATPENIALQFKRPYRDMPSFSHLTDEEVSSLVAYLRKL